MNIDPSQIQLSPTQQAFIARQSEIAGKPWDTLLEELIPGFADPTEEELAKSLAMCDRGMEDIKAGRGKEAKAALREIADRHGLKSTE